VPNAIVVVVVAAMSMDRTLLWLLLSPWDIDMVGTIVPQSHVPFAPHPRPSLAVESEYSSLTILILLSIAQQYIYIYIYIYLSRFFPSCSICK
jgi:hypothetical protein